MPRRRRHRQPPPCPAHVGPAPVLPPVLADEVPLLIRLERAVEERFRAPMLAALQAEVDAVDRGLGGAAAHCPDCGRAMQARGRKHGSFITRFGTVQTRAAIYRCRACRRQTRPLLTRLGAEAGAVSGSLARLLALLGVVVPYELAARLGWHFLGVEVGAMTVWRCVQRLGAACEEYVEQQARFFGSAHHDPCAAVPPPAAVVLGVDGCALGMQVHAHRRRRQPGQPLPPLPPVEEGQFREVKTGVLLLPSERLEPSPGRRSVVRRILCTCLGDADRIFERLWAKLCELGWLSPATVVVIVGDGAEWIWRRATLFPQRCEILDFWHAVEYAWDFARVRYGEGSTVAAKWVHKLADDLRGGRVAAVIARLQAMKVQTPEQRAALDAVIKYYDDNRTRMAYDEYLRRGYGIGSGAVESAHKQVVHARLRQAGMRWSELGAQRLLALRVLLLNEQWALLDRLTMRRRAA
jgi:hypothetical protein